MKGKLVRIRKGKVLGGVIGGIARYVEVDAVLLRLIVAFLVIISSVFSGISIMMVVISYIFAWIIIPEELNSNITEETTQNVEKELELRELGNMNFLRGLGIGLILLGCLFLAKEFMPWIPWGSLWPVVIIVAGVFLLIVSVRKTNDKD